MASSIKFRFVANHLYSLLSADKNYKIKSEKKRIKETKKTESMNHLNNIINI